MVMLALMSMLVRGLVMVALAAAARMVLAQTLLLTLVARAVLILRVQLRLEAMLVLDRLGRFLAAVVVVVGEALLLLPRMQAVQEAQASNTATIT